MSLRTLVGEVEAKLIIFVEDEFAEHWVKSILRSAKNIAIEAIEIYKMGGDGTAVSVHNNRKKDPSVKVPSICIIDGDSRQEDCDQNGVFRLPGEAPELYIYDTVYETIDETAALLSVRLSHKSEEQNAVKKAIENIKISNMDHHLLFVQLGEGLGFLSENTVVEAFLSTWCEKYTDEVNKLLDAIDDYIPRIQ